MLLTLSTTATDLGPATDLGYLLHKHPDRVQNFELSFGTATVLYPEAGRERCTALLTLEVDPMRLARGRGRQSPDFSLAQYVNDRPYAASSLLGVALADVFSTARAGRCRSHQGLADTAIPLDVHLPVLPCRGGADLARRIFEPLGWTVTAETIPLDEGFPAWGDSRYLDLTVRGTCGWPTPSTSSTCCCRCSTTPSTTGRPTTKSTSCCAPAVSGWPTTPSGRSSYVATWAGAARCSRRRSAGSPSWATTSTRRWTRTPAPRRSAPRRSSSVACRSTCSATRQPSRSCVRRAP